MADCKNCGADRSLNSAGLCFDCVDEMLEDGHECKTNGCDNFAEKKKGYCFECLCCMEEDRAKGEKEDRAIEALGER